MAGPDNIQGLPQHSQNTPLSKTDTSIRHTSKETSVDRRQTDTVELSAENTEYQQILKRMEQVPNIRQDRIEKIRQALKDGTYHVDSDSIAKRIIEESLIDNIATNQLPDISSNLK